MIKNKNIIAIIPARGGSKGVPRKNVKLLAGKPLIAHTIEAALKSKHIERVIVSTEDKEISEISKKYKAEVVKRPKELAADKSKTIDTVFHVLDSLKRENYIPDAVILLQPTSPLRTTDDINKAINLFFQNKCELVISVYESGHSFYLSFKIGKKYLEPIFNRKYLNQTRQDLPRAYIPNGAIYISRPKVLLKYKSFYCRKILPYIMLATRSIDIDNETDFKLAELLLKK